MIGRALLRDCTAASAAEFALVLPLLLVLLFGLVDTGRFVWEYNRAEKATQMGARMAVVVDPVAGGIKSATFAGASCPSGILKAGDPICPAALPAVTCNDTSCTCTGCPAGIPGTYNGTAFTNIVTRVQQFEPLVTSANVEVVYQGSGLGYVGDPTGSEVSPLVTVRLKNLQFTPVTSLLFASFGMPSFSTTLTAEDLVGSQSN